MQTEDTLWAGAPGADRRPMRARARLPSVGVAPVVERTLAWFARFRRLAVRYERRADTLEAFHHLAAVLVYFRFAKRWSC
jgi:hypothetical protein